VVDSCHVTGRYDYQLQIAAIDVEDLDATLNALHAEIGAEETSTRLVLGTTPGFPRPPSLGPRSRP
jgi:DNA-binding Lrp family transcriptional regulator